MRTNVTSRAVRRVVALVIYGASLMRLALVWVTMLGKPPRILVVTGLAVIAVLSAGRRVPLLSADSLGWVLPGDPLLIVAPGFRGPG
jgi:hypothetical protein